MQSTNFIITIPEPCHEDWNAMTIDKKGKFCSSCSKSVIDFSNKSDIEIKTILLENTNQKVCGHFEKSQINRPLNININFNELPKNMSSTKVFAIALFFVFGTMLFSCTNFKGQKIDTIEVVNFNKDEDVLVGDISISEVNQLPEDTTEISYVKGETISICKSFVNGGISYYVTPLIQDSTNNSIETSVTGIMEVNIPTKTDTLQTIDSTDVNIIKNNLVNDFIDTQNDLLIYPNPSNGDFTVSYKVLKPADVRIDIFDEKGSLLKTIVNISNQYSGKYQIPVNMIEFNNGIYFVKMLNNDKLTTSKLILQK